jgi:hypothetical protein
MKRFVFWFLLPMLLALAVGIALAPGGWKLLLGKWGAAKDSPSLAQLKTAEQLLIREWGAS